MTSFLVYFFLCLPSCFFQGSVPSHGNLLLKKLAEETPSDVETLKFFYDDECRGNIASMRVEGRIEEANAMEMTRQRVISSVGMEMVEDDEEEDDDL